MVAEAIRHWKIKGKIKIFGYLSCPFCYELAGKLEDAGLEYESHPMESDINRDFIAYKLGREEVKTPVVIFNDDSFMVRPSFDDVWAGAFRLIFNT